MRRITQKLHSRRGASLLYALLLFLVASMVSVVILTSAATAARRLHDDRAREQEYLSLSSAARLLKQAMETEKSVTIVETRVITYGESGEVTGDTTAITYERSGALGSRLANAVDAVRVSGGADISATVHADTDDGLFPADATLACHMTLKHKDAVEGDPVKYPIEGVVTLAGGEGTIYLSAALRDTVVSGTPNTTDEYTGEGEEQRLFRRTEVRKTPLTWTVTLSTNTGGTP